MSPPDPKRALARYSPGGLAVVASRGKWIRAPHLAVLDEKLRAFERQILAGQSPRLMISMPPRHGKSELVSRHMPPWFLGRNPDLRVGLCSHGDEFASEWGGKARALLEEYGPLYFDGVTTSRASRAKDAWDIAGRRGGMWTAGVGGSITGKGCELAIIDDSIKDHEQANSETYRARAKDWYRSTFYTRLHPGAGILLMQTRWHEDDLPGYVLQLARETGEHWELLNLPALAEAGDPLGRQPGEALWPDRFPASGLLRIKATLGSYWFSALYQGRPQPAEGGRFQRSWLRRYRTDGELYALIGPDRTRYVAARDCRRFGTCDLAFTTKKENDYFVVCAWAVTRAHDLLLLDVHRERLEGPDIIPAVKAMAAKWGLEYVGVESVAAQLLVVQLLRKDGMTIRALVADTDKLSRAIPAIARMEAGQIYVPDPPPHWLEDWIDELLAFNKGAHDDQVDCLSYAAIDVQRFGGAPEPDSYRDLRDYAEKEQAAEWFSRASNPIFWQGDDDE